MRLKVIGLLLLVALFAVACGGGETVENLVPTAASVVEDAATAVAVEATEEPAEVEEQPTEAAEPTEATGDAELVLGSPDPLAVSGDIVTAGSSTVFPLSERMVERYLSEGFAGQVTVDSIGSGGGLERFCVAGETDIANASRAIQDDEIAACEAIGRSPIEFRVGTDALAFVVNPANDFVTNLTLEQLALAFSVDTWDEVDPSFPNEPIARYSPGTDSGTFDYLVEEIFDDDSEPLLSAANTQFSEDDNVLVQGVAGDPYAIGYFGFAYYLENSDVLRIIDLEGVEPTAATAEDGSYPLARPLYLYSDAGIMQAKSQVADFINFYLTFVNEEIVDVGYFPASDEALDGARAAWLAAVGQ